MTTSEIWSASSKERAMGVVMWCGFDLLPPAVGPAMDAAAAAAAGVAGKALSADVGFGAD